MKVEIHELCEAFGCAVTLALMAFLVWLFLWATPPQFSAEADTYRYEVEQMEGGAE